MNIPILRQMALVLVVALTATQPATGQSIRGTVIDAVRGARVGRGFVVLIDSTGREVSRTLSRGDGRFLLGVPAPGPYRLRSERIGYRLWESPTFQIQADTTLDFVLEITALPTRLGDLEVVGETSCSDPTGELDTEVIWEEARKALTAASWTANQDAYLYLLHRFRRRWDARRSRVQGEMIGSEAGSAALPFYALDADSLADAGFVIQRGALWDWYAPDANVLLHERFHATHCFNAVRGSGEYTGMVGLEFKPVPDRDVPDIKGSLWLDEESSELRHIEYIYTNAPGSLRDDRIGGKIIFQLLPTGAWFVERWVIRIGEADTRPSVVRNPEEARTRMRLAGFLDRGGQVIGLYGVDGNVLYESPEMVEIYGVVFDSIRGIPLPDERVWIVGTGYEAVTNEQGDYVIHAILDGEYRLTSARLDSLGYMSGPVGATVAPGDTLRLDLTVPSRLTVYRDLCPEIGIPADTRALVGLVRNPDGSPVENVWVSAIWRPGAAGDNRRLVRKRTDKAGRYVLCNVPVGRRLRIDVLLEGLDDPLAELMFRGDLVDITRDGVAFTHEVSDRILRLDLEVAIGPFEARR